VSAARALVFRGLDAWRAEYADVWLRDGRLVARGVQIGVDPLPYEAHYSLDTSPGYDTAHLSVNASGAGWSRHLDLRRDSTGAWDISVGMSGAADLPNAGGNPAEFDGGRDCDLQSSPLTNTMPVLRERLLEGGGPVDFVMAWVALPALTVTRSDQRYEPIGPGRVRYVSLDGDRFTAELELDDDGLVVAYPGLAERVTGRRVGGADPDR
jgi:hypothetical protein